MEVMSFMLRPFYPRRNSPFCPLNKRLGRPHEPVWTLLRRGKLDALSGLSLPLYKSNLRQYVALEVMSVCL
jgi:hypothetical protein